MAHKTLVNGTSYEISGGKTLVNGTAYSVSGGKTLVGGTAYEIGFGGKTLGSLAVGSSVYLQRAGASWEFLVVHQGLPSSMYDSSCNGTWLLMKNILSLQKWDSTDNNYAVSDIKSSLDSEYIYYNVSSSIKQVKLPYTAGTGSSGTCVSGDKGLSSRIFLLSYSELYSSMTSFANPEGSVLSYFSGSGSDSSVCIGYYNGAATAWWLRSPYLGTTTTACRVSITGYVGGNYVGGDSIGVRPAMILPSEMLVDSNYNVIP